MLAGEKKWATVTELTTQIKKTLEMNDQLQHVLLRAEISNFKRHSRGHMYFTLKDERSRISAVMFAGKNRFLKFEPENGMNVLVVGNVSVYEPFGQYQLYVQQMEPDGLGQLYVRFEQLKTQLEKEGLFAPERKKPLPKLPKEIAIVTSPTGAAIQDMISTLKRRFPPARITLFPVLVQGKEAPDSIVTGLERVEAMGEFDVVIVGRGGGSLEELWAFNEEIVARKIASMSMPVVSAVGHETDVTIADFVSDVRAATPTAAAELVAPEKKEMLEKVKQWQHRLARVIREQINHRRDKLYQLQRSYAFRYPARLLQQKEQELDRLIERLHKQMHDIQRGKEERLRTLEKRLEREHPLQLAKRETEKLTEYNRRLTQGMNHFFQMKKERFHANLQKLELLNPLSIMERGYQVSYTEDDTLITSVDQLSIGQSFRMYVSDGTVKGTVSSISKNTIFPEEKEGEKND